MTMSLFDPLDAPPTKHHELLVRNLTTMARQFFQSDLWPPFEGGTPIEFLTTEELNAAQDELIQMGKEAVHSGIISLDEQRHYFEAALRQRYGIER